MSEFLAEASVLIQPDTTRFRAELIAELNNATKGVTVKVPVLVASQQATTAAKQVTAASVQAAAALNTQAAASAALDVEQNKSAVSAAKQTSAISAISRAEKSLSKSHLPVIEAEKELTRVRTQLRLAALSVRQANDALVASEAALKVAVTNEALAEREQAVAIRSKALARAESLIATRDSIKAEIEQVAATEAARKAEERASRSRASSAAREAISNRSQLLRGAGAQGLTGLGFRGATLAASGPFLVGTATVVGLGLASKAAADFQSNLNVLKVTAKATSGEIEAVREEAERLGSDLTLPGVSAADAAQSMTELSKAGLSVRDSIDGARGVLQLAAAAQIDNAAATELAASALNAFGLAGDQAVHVADLLTNASNEAQGSIADIGISLQQVSAVSKQVGVSLDDTVALLTLLARNGLRGSDAGTSLRSAFIRLIAPTDRAKKILSELNIAIRDVNGNVRPEVFSEFAEATRSMGKAQADAAAAIVFGQDAIRAAAILGREGIKSLDAERVALERTGSAAELAAARASGLKGDIAALGSEVETFGLKLGNLVNKPLGGLVRGLREAFVGANKLSTFFGELGDSKSIDILTADAETLRDRIAAINKEVASTRGPRGVPQSLLDEQRKIENVLRGGSNAAAAKEEEIKDRLFAIQAQLQAIAEVGANVPQTLLDQLAKQADDLAKKLEGTVSPAAKAKSSIEDYRNSILLTAGASEGLINRLDETIDRFARVPRAVDAASVGVKKSIFLSPTEREDVNAIKAQETLGLQDDLAIARARKERLDRRLADFHGSRKQFAELRERQAQASLDIVTLERRIADDNRQAARDAQQARDDADRAFLDSLGVKERAAANRVAIAAETDGLKDDIEARKALVRTARQEIEEVRRRVSGLEAKRDKIRELNQRIRDVNREIKRLRKEQVEQARQDRLDAAQRIVEGLDLDVQIAEARGDRQGQINALSREIAALKKLRSLEEKGSNERKALTLQIIQKQNELKELKDAGKKTGDEATSAFELLQQAAETFNSTAGNLINGNQPFAGPTGFTADLSQFLVRREGPTASRGPTAGPAKNEQTSELIKALTKLTEAILGQQNGGRRTPVPVDESTVTSRGDRLPNRFHESQAARRRAEARGGV